MVNQSAIVPPASTLESVDRESRQHAGQMIALQPPEIFSIFCRDLRGPSPKNGLGRSAPYRFILVPAA
jgi:hypothetical protein